VAHRRGCRDAVYLASASPAHAVHIRRVRKKKRKQSPKRDGECVTKIPRHKTSHNRLEFPVLSDMRPESIYVHWWRQLRSPFVLPRVTSKCHECKWEKIDIDVLGCTLCGKVHACEYGTCTHVIETSDGLVCEFSGVVVYTKCFVETEYMDTLCVFGVEMQDLQQHTASGVKQIITTLLFSHRNKTVKPEADHHHASFLAQKQNCQARLTHCLAHEMHQQLREAPAKQ
jgi:hypothetical protein